MPLLNSVLDALEKGDNVRDYQHAARTFVDNNYELQPRYGHLFHVVFNFTPDAARLLENIDKLEIPLLVKQVNLPTFSIDIETLNQYNRQVFSQHKIQYNPVDIVFHDDQRDLIRQLWYRYYSFYYDDSLYKQASGAYSPYDRYADRDQANWGFSRGNSRFFRDIKIYTMLQKRFAEYTLINPMITNFNHGQHSYAANDMMEHQMTINYETVKYATGLVNDINPKGFGDIHYDHTPSPIGIFGRGPSNSILFAGGLLDAADAVLGDLASGNIIGAIVKGGLIFHNTRNANLKDVFFKDLQRAASQVLRGQNPLGDIIIPNALSSLVGNAMPTAVGPLLSLSGNSPVSSNGGNINSNRHSRIIWNTPVRAGNANRVPQGTHSPVSPRKLNNNQPIAKTVAQVSGKTDKMRQIQSRIRDISDRLNGNPQNADFLRRERQDLMSRYRLEAEA